MLRKKRLLLEAPSQRIGPHVPYFLMVGFYLPPAFLSQDSVCHLFTHARLLSATYLLMPGFSLA